MFSMLLAGVGKDQGALGSRLIPRATYIHHRLQYILYVRSRFTYYSQRDLDVLNHPGEVQEANDEQKHLQGHDNEGDQAKPARRRPSVEPERFYGVHLSPRSTQSSHCSRHKNED